MSKNPSVLPPFSFNWIGGDIHGLSNLAGVLYGFADRSNEPVSVLNRTVTRLVAESRDSTWRGSAAGGFKSNLGQDMADVVWLSSHANAIAGIVDELAVRLAKIESWLENQAEQGVRAKYITVTSAGRIGLPSGTSDPRIQKFVQQFNQSKSQAVTAARAARKIAASKLAPEYRALSGGLRNYRDNHKTLLSDSELEALDSSMKGLSSSFTVADNVGREGNLHWGAAVGGAWKGAAEVGGTMGLFGIETGPFDIPITVAGATIGGVGGFFKGLVTGHALFEK